MKHADLGRAGGRPPPPGPPFVLFSDIHFRLTDPEIILKMSSAPKYTTFEEGARAKKKTILFFGQKFPKIA